MSIFTCQSNNLNCICPISIRCTVESKNIIRDKPNFGQCRSLNSKNDPEASLTFWSCLGSMPNLGTIKFGDYEDMLSLRGFI